MFLEITLAILIGMTAGVFTGLIPGVHVNLIAALVVSSLGYFAGVDGFLLVVFLVSLSLTHSFLDSIPGVYLGAPDPSQVVGVLPAHQLFLQGKGHHAVVYTLVGSLASLFLCVLFAPIVFKVVTPMYSFLRPYIGKIIVGLVLLLFLLSKKVVNVFFFLISGLLGILVFALPSQDQVLLPLLSGLFGTSTLLISLLSITKPVIQHTKRKSFPLELVQVEQNSLRATITGFFASFLPGLGSSQGAVLASATMKRATLVDYLLLVGGINTVNFSLSLLTLFLLDKARNGAVVAIKEFFVLELQHLFVLLGVLLFVGGIATQLGLKLSRFCAHYISKVNYQVVVLCVIGFVTLMVLVLSKPQGLVILFTATSLGILATKYGSQKNMLLGCLLLPVITYLW